MSAAHDGRQGNRRTGSYAWIPEHLIYDRRISDAEFRLLAMLAHRSNYRTGLTNGDCSAQQLADVRGVLEQTVWRQLKRLRDVGAVLLHRPGFGPRPHQFRLPWVSPEVIHTPRQDRGVADEKTGLPRDLSTATPRQDRGVPTRDTSLLLTDNFQSAGAPRVVPRALIQAAIEEGKKSSPGRAGVRYDSDGES